MLRKLSAIGLMGLASYSTTVSAFDFDPSTFSFNGFGTLGAVYSSEDQATFTGPGFKIRGAGYGDKISTDVDTRLGVQAIAKFTDKLTATVQLVGEQNIDGNYAPTVEWANLKYAITPDLNVRVGRTAMPSYLFSDTRKVGYAIPWVRAPYEVYDLLPITNSDGVDVSYKIRSGGVTSTLQAIYGENIADLGFVKGKAKDVWGLFNTVEINALTLKVAYQEQDLYFGSYKLPNMWQTEPTAVEFMTLGAHYDPGTWFAGAEWASRNMEGGFIDAGKTNAWYVTGGRRMGDVTPYFIVANQKPEKVVPPNASTEQTSYSLGARWDFMRSFNLKAEYQYIDLPKGSAGLLKVPMDPFTFMPLSNFEPGGEVNLVSVQINFVF